MDTNNIIMFPIEKITDPSHTALADKIVPQTVDEIKDVTYFLRTKKVEEIMEVILPLVSQGFTAYGINFNGTKDIKHCAFMCESIRSLIHRHFGIDHPIQNLAENVFNISSDGKVSIKSLNVKNIKLNANNE